MSHFRTVCEFGVQHSTCRCMSNNKEVRRIACDRPQSHAKRSKLTTTVKADPMALLMNDEMNRLVTERLMELVRPEDQGAIGVVNRLADRASELEQAIIRHYDELEEIDRSDEDHEIKQLRKGEADRRLYLHVGRK